MSDIKWYNMDEIKPQVNNRKYRIANADKTIVMVALYSAKADPPFKCCKGRGAKFKVQYWSPDV